MTEVMIKALEWGWNGAMWHSDCVIGQYHVAKTDNPRNDRYMVTYLYRGPNGNAASHTIGYVDGADAAKAAAQSDYAARIRSALTATPAADVAEAAIMVADAIDADMLAFNALAQGFEAHPDMLGRHFFSKALRHYAAAIARMKEAEA